MSRVVLVVLDSLRADAVDWEDPNGETPNLAALARDGLVFERAIAPAGWTLPSHVSMLSGKFPTEHGFQASTSARRAMIDALTRLKEESCRDWFLPAWLGARGVESYLGSANVWVSPLSGLARWFTTVDYVPFPKGRPVPSADGEVAALPTPPNQEAPRLSPGLRRIVPLPLKHAGKFFVEALIRFRNAARQFLPVAMWAIRRRDKGAAEIVDAFDAWLARAPETFFSMFNLIETHNPHVPTRRFGRFDIHALLSVLAHPGALWSRRMHLHNWRYKSLSQRTIEHLRKSYRAEVRYADHCVGRIVQALERHDMTQDTLVIVTGDHGEAFNERDLIGHGLSLGDPVANVPLVVSGPAIKSGRVTEPVSLSALASTVGQFLTSEETPFPVAPLWSEDGRGQAQIEVEAPWVHFHTGRSLKTTSPPEGMDKPAAAFYHRHMKLIVGSFWGEALFDLSVDPREEHDLIGEIPVPEELASMRARWQERLAQTS